ncbi:MAG: hypothetical protein KBT19_08110 [Lachnospiraceae bacterium]|nr:hypothetical protein [Candidatus Colinaster equi]
MAKHKIKFKKSVKIAFWALLALAIIASCYVTSERKKASKNYTYSEHLDETVMTINGTDITLKEMSYYIARSEEIIQDMAVKYNPADPMDFWKTHFSAGTDSQFTDAYAKSQAEEMCIYCMIMDNEANQNGLALSEDDKQLAADEAEQMFGQLSKGALDNTRLDLETICKLKEKEQVARNYVLLLADTKNISADELDYHGDYYLNTIRPAYDVQINGAVWNPVKLGKITVNTGL